MQLRAIACFFLSLLALWLVSAEANWRYVPWGTTGITERYFAYGVVELFAALSAIVLSFRVLAFRNLIGFLVLGSLSVMLLSGLEVIYWSFAEPDEHTIVFRQIDGVRVAPIALALALLLLEYGKLGMDRGWTLLKAGKWAGAALIWGAVLVIVTLGVRNRFQGPEYHMWDVVLFAILLETSAIAVAILGRSLPSLKLR